MRYIIILICSLIGIVSVICSPAQFTRFNLEAKESYNIITSIKDSIKFLITTFFIKDFYRPHMILLLLTLILSIITIRKSSKLTDEEGFILISSVILGIGSQAMILVSPVYGERNTIFAALMIILFSATLITRLPKNKYLKSLEKIFYTFLIIISSFNILNIYKNYKITNEIQNENIKIINEYKKSSSNEIIELSKLANDNYGWSMPYISPYHENWFKIYYEIQNVEIVWKDYNE